jgi:hypothetical protein
VIQFDPGVKTPGYFRVVASRLRSARISKKGSTVSAAKKCSVTQKVCRAAWISKSRFLRFDTLALGWHRSASLNVEEAHAHGEQARILMNLWQN